MSEDDKAATWTGKRIDFADFAAKLIARRDELGPGIAIPRNNGTRRTASKRALLQAIRATGADW